MHSAHKIFIKPQETIFAKKFVTVIKSTPTQKLELFDQISSGWLTTEFHRLLVIKPGTISTFVLEQCVKMYNKSSEEVSITKQAPVGSLHSSKYE